LKIYLNINGQQFHETYIATPTSYLSNFKIPDTDMKTTETNRMNQIRSFVHLTSTLDWARPHWIEHVHIKMKRIEKKTTTKLERHTSSCTMVISTHHLLFIICPW